MSFLSEGFTQVVLLNGRCGVLLKLFVYSDSLVKSYTQTCVSIFSPTNDIDSHLSGMFG